MKIRHEEDYRELRKREYPAVGDQLDAMVKLARAMTDAGIELPADVAQWVAKCEAVKAKYRKPKEL